MTGQPETANAGAAEATVKTGTLQAAPAAIVRRLTRCPDGAMSNRLPGVVGPRPRTWLGRSSGAPARDLAGTLACPLRRFGRVQVRAWKVATPRSPAAARARERRASSRRGRRSTERRARASAPGRHAEHEEDTGQEGQERRRALLDDHASWERWGLGQAKLAAVRSRRRRSGRRGGGGAGPRPDTSVRTPSPPGFLRMCAQAAEPC